MIRTLAKCLIAILTLSSVEASNTVIQNTNQFDNWGKEAENALDQAAENDPIRPGERFTWSLDVCIFNEVANVSFEVFGGENGSAYTQKLDITPTGEDC